MKKLAAEYQKSINLLSCRIHELNIRRAEVLNNCSRLDEDPEVNVELIDIKSRINNLTLMKNDLVEVTKEIRHYYDRWWWRSGDYTLNKGRSKSFIYAGPSR